eukprot:scaffold28297_cov91-Cyclotella_meneghiniana.AAC.1
MERIVCSHCTKSDGVGRSKENVRWLGLGRREKTTVSTVRSSAQRMSARECTLKNFRTQFSVPSESPEMPCFINQSTMEMSRSLVG